MNLIDDNKRLDMIGIDSDYQFSMLDILLDTTEGLDDSIDNFMPGKLMLFDPVEIVSEQIFNELTGEFN